MSRGIFITATGTDIGKTFVTALIVKKLRDHGINAGYYKAALSGAEYINGKLVAVDADYVCKIAGLADEPNSLVSYIYETPVAPHLASRLEGNPIEMDKLVADFDRIKTKFDFVTAEGSGGIVCPLRLGEKDIMLTDVIKALNLDIIIVALAGLGTINSLVLTWEHAKLHNLTVKGIILNHFEPGNFLHEDNKKQIEYLTGIPVITCLSSDAADLSIDIGALTGLYKEL